MTGVQTCALPISALSSVHIFRHPAGVRQRFSGQYAPGLKTFVKGFEQASLTGEEEIGRTQEVFLLPVLAFVRRH